MSEQEKSKRYPYLTSEQENALIELIENSKPSNGSLYLTVVPTKGDENYRYYIDFTKPSGYISARPSSAVTRVVNNVKRHIAANGLPKEFESENVLMNALYKVITAKRVSNSSDVFKSDLDLLKKKQDIIKESEEVQEIVKAIKDSSTGILDLLNMARRVINILDKSIDTVELLDDSEVNKMLNAVRESASPFEAKGYVDFYLKNITRTNKIAQEFLGDIIGHLTEVCKLESFSMIRQIKNRKELEKKTESSAGDSAGVQKPPS